MLDHDHRELSKIFDEVFLILTSYPPIRSVGDLPPETPAAVSIDSSAGTASAKELYQKLDLFWARLAVHIRAEHLHMFPALLRANNPELDQAATTAAAATTATAAAKRAETTAEMTPTTTPTTTPTITPTAAIAEATLKGILDRLKKEHDVFMTGIWTQLKEIKKIDAHAAEASSKVKHTAPETKHTASGIKYTASAVEEAKPLPDNVKQNILTALRNLETIYHKHNDEEENTIYRWCETFLTRETQAEISERMKKEIEKMPPRFQNK